MESRTEKVNKNLTFSSDIDEPIILFKLSTIELIFFCTISTTFANVSIFIYFAAENE